MNAIHQWFELSHAQYLTIPRSVLQSMPEAWQERFVACLEELDETIDWRPSPGQRYYVTLEEEGEAYNEETEQWDPIHGPPISDPLMDYERGRRRIPHRTVQS